MSAHDAANSSGSTTSSSSSQLQPSTAQMLQHQHRQHQHPHPHQHQQQQQVQQRVNPVHYAPQQLLHLQQQYAPTYFVQRSSPHQHQALASYQAMYSFHSSPPASPYSYMPLLSPQAYGAYSNGLNSPISPYYAVAAAPSAVARHPTHNLMQGPVPPSAMGAFVQTGSGGVIPVPLPRTHSAPTTASLMSVSEPSREGSVPDLTAPPLRMANRFRLPDTHRQYLGRLIGPGGSTIKELCARHGIQVSGLPSKDEPHQTYYLVGPDWVDRTHEKKKKTAALLLTSLFLPLHCRRLPWKGPVWRL